jgi:hypothetical protein
MRQLGEQLEQLAYRAIGAAIEVHQLLGPGFLESENQLDRQEPHSYPSGGVERNAALIAVR